MKQERTFLQKTGLFFKGLAMGAANKVPGVSGGTVSFVLSFYEEMIYSFQKINIKAFKLLLSGRFRSFYQYVNGQFLLLVMGGSMFSYFSISLVLDYFLKHYELYVWSWFFGMIIGSVFYIYKDFGDWNFKNTISFVIGVSVGVGISFMTPAQENDNLWFVFLCGIIGVSGMTLPGLSGSFILILLGNYVLLLVDSVNGLFTIVTGLLSGNFDVLEVPENIRYLKIVSVFTAGSAFGLVSISHVLGYVLKRWYQIVTAVIIGFIAGSLGIVWPWKQKIFTENNGEFLVDDTGNKIIQNYERFFPDFSNSETWVAVLYIVLGIALILGIDYYDTNRKSKK
ncbi:MAG: putative membrane protein [Polaribacter sp.]|jgi:putative membrane protein